jgi:hypothetical protein
MGFSKDFERKLDSLFQRRTFWLRHELGRRGVGRPTTFRRKTVNRAIKELQLIASHALAPKLAREEFGARVRERKNYHVKGRGPDEKRDRFRKWFSRHFADRHGIVYAFWNRRRECVYVGKTGPHGIRPSDHFDKYWFGAVRRVTVFSIRGSSHVGKLECLAIHRFQPKRNKNKAATRKWTKACPLCTTHRYIESELRGIFRLR